MAEFRNIHTRIWKDTWFSELAPDEKLLFIYLFSNERASVCGMYELPIKYIVFETGLSKDRVLKILDRFSKDVKAYYKNGVVWVVNLKRYNSSGDSSKVAIRIAKDIATIPDCEIKRMYHLHENIPYPEQQIPYSMKSPDTDTDTDTDTETETIGAEKPAPRSKAPDTRSKHPAIQLVKAVTNRYPPKDVYDFLIATIGDSPDGAKFKLVWDTWRARGFNPANYSGMMEWYKGIIPNGKPKQAAPAGPEWNQL